MLGSTSVLIYNQFHVRRANYGRITPFKGVLFFLPLIRGNPFTQWHEILSWDTVSSNLSYGNKKFELMLTGRAKAYIAVPVQ